MADTLTLHDTARGAFTATLPNFFSWMKLPRKEIVRWVCSVYEGQEAGEKGHLAAHWKGTSKTELAIIAADCFKDAPCKEVRALDRRLNLLEPGLVAKGRQG